MFHIYNLNIVKFILKTNDLILLINNYNNKIFITIDYKIKKIKAQNFILLHYYSIKKLLLSSFIINSELTLLYSHKIFEVISNIVLANNYSFLFSLKFNNIFYSQFLINKICSFNYYQIQKLYYKTFYNLFIKFFQNNVSRTHVSSTQN